MRGSGRSNWVLGGCGWRLQAGGFSGQKEVQVFVVLFSACGEGEGWRSGALERWMSGECLGGFWEAVVDWSDGNSGVGCFGFTV